MNSNSFLYFLSSYLSYLIFFQADAPFLFFFAVRFLISSTGRMYRAQRAREFSFYYQYSLRDNCLFFPFPLRSLSRRPLFSAS